jgi:hypothetical protein
MRVMLSPLSISAVAGSISPRLHKYAADELCVSVDCVSWMYPHLQKETCERRKFTDPLQNTIWACQKNVTH